MKIGDSVKLSTIVSYNPSNLWIVKWNTPNGHSQRGMKSSDIQVMKEDVSSE